jgi:hypothetical protein
MELLPVAYFAGTQEWLIIGLCIVPTIFWAIMLVDAIRRDFSDSTMKLIWVLVILLTQFVGALIYCFFGRSMGTAGTTGRPPR